MPAVGDIFEECFVPNQLCFAPWHDNYYYPAVISDVHPNFITVAYLDGYAEQVSPKHIVSIQEALDTMDFECEYGWLGYYRGIIISQQPIVFEYDDGIVEQTELRKLRGLR